MNKILIILVCAVFLISMSGCGVWESESIHPVENGGTTGVNSPTSSNAQQITPYTVRFDTVEDINKFFVVNRTNGDKNVVEGSVGNIFGYETQSKAEQISTTMAELYFPITDTGVDAEYYPTNQSLDSIYIIDGIQYCFIYFFDRESDWDYGDKPAFSNVQVGPYAMDFFELEHPHNEGERYLLGHLSLGSIDLLVRIRGTQGQSYENFSFECFDFVPLSSVGGDAVG